MSGHDHDHDHDHDDHHGHHHDHEHGSELSEAQLRVRALESILTEKGYVDPLALDAVVEAFETKVGPHKGAQVVARAWVDPVFKKALIEDATGAITEIGMFERVSEHIIAVENTPKLHNICLLYTSDAADE